MQLSSICINFEVRFFINALFLLNKLLNENEYDFQRKNGFQGQWAIIMNIFKILIVKNKKRTAFDDHFKRTHLFIKRKGFLDLLEIKVIYMNMSRFKTKSPGISDY